MHYFDAKEGLLVFHKVENPDMGYRFDLLKDIREAYSRFEHVTCLRACEYINEWLASENINRPERFDFFVVEDAGYRNEQNHFTVKAKVRGKNQPPITVLPLPYMDATGKLHFFDGSVKNFVNRLTSSDDMSYNDKDSILSIMTSKKNIRIDASGKTKDIRIQGRHKEKKSMSELITYLSTLEGHRVNMVEEIRNPLLLSVLASEAMAEDVLLYHVIKADATGLVNNLSTDDYQITSVRNSINASVTIDRALGMTLSRDVAGYEAGTYITTTIIADLKKQKVNKLYVEAIIPDPNRKIQTGLNGETLLFTVIPKGTENTAFLAKLLPEYAQYSVMPHDIPLYKSATDATGIIDMTGYPATEENLVFLKSMGFKGIRYKGSAKDGVGSSREWPFEMEIIANNTLRYSDVYTLSECMNMGVDPSDWFGITETANTDHITSDDLLALYSTLGFMKVFGVNPFMDRDRDFLKKVELSDVALEVELTKAIQSHINTYKDRILEYVKGTNTNQSNEIFQGLRKLFKSQLTYDKLIETPDTTNMIAELSQAVHITTILKKAPEIVNEIAIPYYGRLCLYETPEGQKLGLVNNKALGCQIKNGNLCVPVRKVIKVGDEITIGSEITDLTVTEESRIRISDVLSLEPGSKPGFYKNTRVIAKVPNPEPEGERCVYANIYAEDLDYVYAHTEEHLSVVSNMIPFACSDDAVRVSFGTKMIKSAIYLLDPDIPRVQTSMYRDVFKSTNAYLVCAEENGTVLEIRPDMLLVQYDGQPEETEYRIKEFNVTKDAVVFMRYKVSEGQRVHKGQIMVDCSATSNGYYCPGRSELIAYVPTGYNYEDALHVCERATLDYISVGNDTIEKTAHSDSTVSKDGIYKYYKLGDVMAEIETKNASGDIQTVPVRVTHHGGIWYNLSVETSKEKKTYTFNVLGFNKLGTGDKMSGLHGNKGVVSQVYPNSWTPMLANGTPIKIFPNPHGLPSRMNCGQILEGHVGLCAEVLNLRIVSDPFNGASLGEVKELMKLTYELANCGNASACRSVCAKYGLEESLVQHIENNMERIMSWAGTFNEYGDAKLWNPLTCEWYEHEVTIGVSTFLKMKQEAEKKISYRGGIAEEAYKITTSQPPKGDGSQKMGDMELYALLAYGIPNYIHEAWNEKSDNEGARTNMELQAIGSPLRVPDEYLYPRATYNLIYKLQAMGFHLYDTENRLPDTTDNTSSGHFIYDVNGILKAKGEDSKEDKEEDVYDTFF